MDKEKARKRFEFILERAKNAITLNKIVKAYGNDCFKATVEYFNEKMEEEVVRENYEACASIRDIIGELNKKKELFVI